MRTDKLQLINAIAQEQGELVVSDAEEGSQCLLVDIKSLRLEICNPKTAFLLELFSQFLQCSLGEITIVLC